MKVIKDNKLYVQERDLGLIFGKPFDVSYYINSTIGMDFVEITDDESKKKVIESSFIVDYDEYLNKIDFLNNYYAKMYNSVSYYRTNEATPKQKKIIAKNYFADKISFCYFDNKEDLDRLNDLLAQLEKAILVCLKDQDKKEQAILFELENHECFYTWELQPLGFLLGYGITANEIRQVFDKHLKEHEDLY